VLDDQISVKEKFCLRKLIFLHISFSSKSVNVTSYVMTAPPPHLPEYFSHYPILSKFCAKCPISERTGNVVFKRYIKICTSPARSLWRDLPNKLEKVWIYTWANSKPELQTYGSFTPSGTREDFIRQRYSTLPQSSPDKTLCVIKNKHISKFRVNLAVPIQV